MIGAGETVLVHDEQRERHVRPTAMVAGTELHGQMRRRVHRHRRADQDLRLSSVLRDAAVQHLQRVQPYAAAAAAADRLSGRSVPVAEERRDEAGGPRRTAARATGRPSVRRHGVRRPVSRVAAVAVVRFAREKRKSSRRGRRGAAAAIGWPAVGRVVSPNLNRATRLRIITMSRRISKTIRFPT